MATLDVGVAETPPLNTDEHGVVRIAGTRVTLDTLVEAWQEGASAEGIQQQYDSLHLADIYAVIGYYLRHQEEVEAYLQERRRQSDETRRDNEARFPSQGVRKRLLARRSKETAA